MFQTQTVAPEACRIPVTFALLVGREETVSPVMLASAVRAVHRTGVAVDVQAQAAASVGWRMAQAVAVHTILAIAELK
ncbi:TPA: hypothetical protein N3109_005618 [Klebsiella pneumoniae]|nr:hypothetical protein [Serratia marcescens]HCM6931389.1 hypothetical protein [Klebsiella pneumoniae]HCM7595249.1 hypothetical protein [Klebsiella pneumoniae]